MQQFFCDFGVWTQGMLLVFIIYHLSGFIFTKDKSFFWYIIFLVLTFILSFILVDSLVSNSLSEKTYTIILSFQWMIQYYMWFCLAKFFIEFLGIDNEHPFFANVIHIYFNSLFILLTLGFIIDVLFFEKKYFLNYTYTILFVCTSLFIIVYVFYYLLLIKHPLVLVFTIGFLVFWSTCFNYYINHFYELHFLNEIISPKNLYVIGMFFSVLIISSGLGFKYQLFRKERDEYNLQLINQLQREETLRDQANEELSDKIDETIIELKTASEEAEKLKLTEIETRFENEINKLKLSTLLSYMNPHFLFNSLNSIKVFIIDNDPRKATFYLNKFSKLIRKFLEASTESSISLTEEIETSKLYISIENIRFESQIKTSFTLQEIANLDEFLVPPLLLHPFIENAIWHGLSPKKNERELKISLEKEPNYIVIKIQDNGIGRRSASSIEKNKNIKRTSFGIEASKQRINTFYAKKMYKPEVILNDIVDNNKVKGTRVTLKLPLK